MSDGVEIIVNGTAVRVGTGQTVASALLAANTVAFRTSARGETRGPLCGMGVCYECRVTIDGLAHQRACLIPVREGMNIRTTTTP
jgi:D-hydroxyproline dehydrogenase subunit gamma